MSDVTVATFSQITTRPSAMLNALSKFGIATADLHVYADRSGVIIDDESQERMVCQPQLYSWPSKDLDSWRTNDLWVSSKDSGTESAAVDNAVYSVWTHILFSSFLVLFAAGIFTLTVGVLSSSQLISAFGPLILSVAFGCLWCFVRRATREHAN